MAWVILSASFFAVIIGALVAWLLYVAGQFIRKQILGGKNYTEHTNHIKILFGFVPLVALTALLVGMVTGGGFDIVIVFSALWGATVGYFSLESYADQQSWLPEYPKDMEED